MKSTSEPLDVHHPSQIKNEFNDYTTDTHSSVNTSKQRKTTTSKNYSDTHAVYKNSNKPKIKIQKYNVSLTQSETTDMDKEETTRSMTPSTSLNNETDNTSSNIVTNSLESKTGCTVSSVGKKGSEKFLGKLSLYNLVLNQYSHKTLLGNWLEERVRQNYKATKAQEKECIYRSPCIPANYFEQPVCLSTQSVYTVNFMDNLILKNDATLKHNCHLMGHNVPRDDSYLKVDYLSKNALTDDDTKLADEYPAICHLLLKENFSMVFKIKSADCKYLNETQSQILYGQNFYLTTFDECFYLYSENNLTDRTKFANLSSVCFKKFESICIHMTSVLEFA